MQYDVSTPTEYMNALDNDWRKDTLSELRLLILAQDDGIEESINYKMLRFSISGAELFHLNAQKQYVSLYCGNTEKIDPSGELLTGLNLGKGCIRFSKTVVVANTHIETFIQRAISLLLAGNDIGC